MEGNNINNSADFNKHKTGNSSVNSNSKDGSNSGQWQEPHRRDHSKSRERSQEGEWNRERTFHGKNLDNFREEDSHDRFPDEQLPNNLQLPHPQQPTPFPTHNYSATDSSYVENNRRAMSMMSTYNMYAAMNSQWGLNSMDGMPMTPTNMPVNPSSTAIPMATGMDMTQAAGQGMHPFAYMGMPGDSNMYGMMGMGNYCQYGVMNPTENIMVGSVKEVVHLTKCVLYPPNPNAPPPTTRGKPLGCKTVFVGGLPENANEELMKEVFEKCGDILTIRMSKKNFCHIRFSNESSVESALYFSGFRIKIENKDEAAFTGRLHVDYAQARDDQHEYECQQRAVQREMRHRERMEQDYYRTPTPPPIVHYSEHEATVLGEKLRTEDTFQQAIHVLTTWLDRGECNKRNSGTFYSMIQSTNSHVRRLMNEKSKYEDELNKAKTMLKKQMQGILLQFNEIGKVFNTASLQKVWDHFTKPQRKNIELWKKQTEEIKNAHVEEVLNDRIEDEMDLSEDEENDETVTKKIQDSSEMKKKFDEELYKLQQEVEDLRCQLEVAEKEAILTQSETTQIVENHLHEIQKLKEALDKESKIPKRSSEEAELKDSQSFKKKVIMPKTETENPDMRNNFVSSVSSSSTSATFNESEGRLITLISTFLHVHPFGANIDYICSYLHQIDSTMQPRDVENLMKRFPSLFREYSTGIGASLGKRWKYLGFQP